MHLVHLDRTPVQACSMGLKVLTALLGGAAVLLGAAVDYGREIRPIVAKNCYACHGPDESARQANMHLDTRKAAIGEDGSHKAILPGDSANSRVVLRITHPDLPMPPSGQRLSGEEIALIKRWIDEGAHYDTHWAFEAPVRQELPEVKNTAWPRNEIDRFVLARLEQEGVEPSPEADRHTLVRRLYLDLIGLPPTPAQVDAFVNDASPDAYEKVVDELLASPHYGERWARVWLDLARYADSKGYESDPLRSIWPYRDWVIRALNNNMPFDRFTTAQLAGDLLPVMSQDNLIATGFHRNTMTNDEGGTDNEEFRDLAIKDRLATTGQVWMGMTWGCAQCHSHKYDPISHKEYYQLYAFLNQTADTDTEQDTPTLEIDKDTTTLILRELPPDQQRQTRIHNRGSFLDPGDPVEAAAPAALHPFPEKAPRNRLGLAQWLVDERNPLTARVAVNRFWARLFGTGIVETEEDFGNQGAAPTHPKLLDWLATEFVRLKWDMKAIQRTMVMSAAYRQSSDATTERIERDPRNQLLSRGARVRLSAEMVRDQMLAVSGLLSEKMYGKPVMPLQPEKVWQVVYSGDSWETSEGEDRYRRALYTLWRRTSPYPSMITFDAPTGEVCTLRRVQTNTPLQALVTLNDPISLEAAQHLAARALEAGGADIAKTIERAYMLTLGRLPSAAEVARSRKLFEQARSGLAGDSAAARELVHMDRLIYKSDRRRTVLPTSREAAQIWRSTTAEPPSGWQRPDFDAFSWTESPGLFGYLQPPKKKEGEEGNDNRREDRRKIRSKWDSERVWLRREFVLDGAPLESMQVSVEYRGSFEIWINGVPAAASGEETSGAQDIEVSDEAMRSLHPGPNVIAVAAQRPPREEPKQAAAAANDAKDAQDAKQENVDQYIDAGLRAFRKPDLGPERSDDADRAAWVMVAHVLLNLDETLTKR
jgi:mono/diheme cytochrome c family protein